MFLPFANLTYDRMRPVSGTVSDLLEVGDSVFIIQETTHGFVYKADGGSVLTFRGEILTAF